jgi:hypothetical protein
MDGWKGALAAPALIALLWASAGTCAAQAPPPTVSPDRPEVTSPDADAALFFNDYSWRSFIALNWPAVSGAADRGKPDRSRSFGDASGPRVWTTSKSRYELFQPGGAPPPPWASYAGENPCGPGIANDVVTLHSFRPFSDFNQAGFDLKKVLNPLVAQNRTYVRYEVRVNEPEFNSIADHKWYIASYLPTRTTFVPFNEGSTAIKAAWRILTEKDTPAIRARYYVVENAQVYDVRSRKCTAQDIALVGLHIVTKTKSQPQWIWSSFEHVDNVPGKTTEPKPPAGVPFSFHDPNQPPTLDPALPPHAISAANPPDPDPTPMQVVRQQAIAPETMAINRAYWNLPGIKGTVWEHYMLVMTQWPTDPIPESPDNAGTPTPSDGVVLSNTTMETYFQFDAVSCMQCHQKSNDAGRDFVMFVTTEAFPAGVPDPPQPFGNRITGDAVPPAGNP